jgi:hypothetical protein
MARHFKTMPAGQRQKFILAVLSLEAETEAPCKGNRKRVKWPDVEARARRIFRDRVLPNLILLGRAEAAL